MSARIIYVLTHDVRQAKVFKSRQAAYMAAKTAARELGLPRAAGGVGSLGDGRYTAHLEGRGWLMVAPAPPPPR